jgi:CO/xanthine dehydrogenase FAD-binding subunit
MRGCASDFDLRSARSLDEALALLAEGYRPMAGGTDLMVLFNAGKLQHKQLVCTLSLSRLRGITEEDGWLRIGASTTYTEIRESPLLNRKFPLLPQAAAWTGGIATQNRGTLAGNIANASPAADSAPVLLAYDAELQLLSERGARRIPYKDFHIGYKRMMMAADELIEAIYLPLRDSSVNDYGRIVGTRGAQAISKVSIAATAQFENGRLGNVRVALGSVASTPVRCLKTEGWLSGQALTPALLSEAGNVIQSEINPIDDLRSTAAYRSLVSSNLLKEFLTSLR